MTGKLTGQFTGDGRTAGAMRDTFIGHESGRSVATPGGLALDGAVYGLDGQPPAARGGTWGDMSWTRSVFYRLRGVLRIGELPDRARALNPRDGQGSGRLTTARPAPGPGQFAAIPMPGHKREPRQCTR